MLFLVGLGAANLNSQVRIGGDIPPNDAAVLDLNATDATTNGTKGLALPRVTLSAVNTPLAGTPTINGMMVYNTGGSLSAGVYFWNGSNWIIGLTDTIASGGLNKTGDGKIGIRVGGVTTGMIADGAITGRKITTIPSDSGRFLMSNGSQWLPARLDGLNVTNKDSIKTIQPLRAVNISISLDTVLHVVIPANGSATIYAAGVLHSDVCVNKGPTYDFIIYQPTNGSLVVRRANNQPLDNNAGIRCFRLSY